MKKILAIVLAAVLLFSLCTGCTAPNRGQSPANPASNSPSGSATTPQKLVIFYPFQTVTSTNDNIKMVETKLEEMMAEDGLFIDLDWIIIPRESSDEKKNTILASGEQLDAMVGDIDDLGVDIFKPGLVRPISDLIDQYGSNLKKIIPEETWAETFNVKGEITAIPSYFRDYWNGTIIRKDWLDDAGLEMPTSIDELEIVMEAFKQRGNVIPAGGKPWFMESHLASAVSGGVTAENGWETESPEGEFIQAYEHPNYIKFLELYNKWISNGWFDPDFLVTEDKDYESMLYTGRMGIYFAAPRDIDKHIPLIQAQNPNAVLEVAPVFSGPMGEAALQENSGIRYVTYVTQFSKNPELVVQYLDWLVSDPEHYKVARYGIEGVHYVMDGDTWSAPESAGGDENKRGYTDIFAPLEYEALNIKKKALYYDVEATQEYYRSLTSYKHPFKRDGGNFIIDWDAVGVLNGMDIWTEIYNIAAGARPLSDYPQVVKDYESTVTDQYKIIREQYQEWKSKG